MLDQDACPAPPGEYGDLVVTDLIDTVFPLIRYKIGDRGRLLKRNCSCSSSFPLMDYVAGRITDFITLPNGRRIPGEFLTTIFDDYPNAVRKFWIHQSENFDLTIYYAPRESNYDQALQKVRLAMLQITDRQIRVECKMDETGPPVIGGKPRFISSQAERD